MRSMDLDLRFVLVLIIIASIPIFAGAQTDTVVASVEKHYRITYENGETNRFAYVFTAHLLSHMKEHGRASQMNPFKDSTRLTLDGASIG